VAIDKGIEEASKRCGNVGASLAEIVSVEEVPTF
jgi:hypothetical protein